MSVKLSTTLHASIYFSLNKSTMLKLQFCKQLELLVFYPSLYVKTVSVLVLS